MTVTCHSNSQLSTNDFCEVDPSVSSDGNGEYTIYYKSGHLWQEYNGWAVDGIWPDALPDDYYFKTENYIMIKVLNYINIFNKIAVII